MKIMEDFDEYYNNNPLAQKQDARFNLLSDEKKEKLMILEEQDVKEYQLKVIKRKRIKPQKGNVFVVSPKENMYFWGIVINSDIEFFKGDDERFSVVFILKDRAESPTDTNIPKSITNLLIDPAIVGRWYWNKGFFYNVGIDIEIPDDVDYGFYDIMGRQYVDEYGNTIERVPELVGVYGANTGQGIAYEMNYELIASGIYNEEKRNLIRDIINEWDPICLFSMAPENEYEDEINQVYNLLKGENLSIERIEEGIEKIFTKSFGEELFYSFTSKCKCREVAEKLHQIIDLIVAN